MRRNLPPLNTIKAFEVAAKYESFTKAAEELCVTQSAISKHISILEEHLGVPLFFRKPQHLTLTEAGRKYYKQLVKAFDIIERATAEQRVRPAEVESLSINVMPSLSHCWLMPRLRDFKKAHPELMIHINTGEGNDIDFATLNADMAIRSSDVGFKGIHSQLLMQEEMVLVANKAFIAEQKNPLTVKDIADLPFIDYIPHPYMKTWLTSQGLPYHPQHSVMVCEHFFMVIEAVKQQLGIGFVPYFLIQKELEEGQLISLLDISYRSNFSYYLLYPRHTSNLNNIKLFYRWLSKQL